MNKDVENIKSHLTTSHFSVRRPYRQDAEVVEHISSYICTANTVNEKLLFDMSGNRRFLVLNLDTIDKNYSNDIDIKQVIAQAIDYYNNNIKNTQISTTKELIPYSVFEDMIKFNTGTPSEFDELNEIITVSKNDTVRLSTINKLLQIYSGLSSSAYRKDIIEKYFKVVHNVEALTNQDRIKYYKGFTINNTILEKNKLDNKPIN